ncbi:MAG: hypothetical protein KGL39_16540 [Patescibacteria group bacterium]|nr:hypothetical protein [Patescibacteria group bacterium]
MPSEVERLREILSREGLLDLVEFVPVEDLISQKDAEIASIRAECGGLRAENASLREVTSKARGYVETATHGVLSGASQEARYTLAEIDDALRVDRHAPSSELDALSCAVGEDEGRNS